MYPVERGAKIALARLPGYELPWARESGSVLQFSGTLGTVNSKKSIKSEVRK
jgi:hypothetical protein